MDNAFSCPIFFVLGNHDFYHGSIEHVREQVMDVARTSRRLTYLSRCAEPIALTASLGLVGHDGWGDARLGDFEGSRLLLNDFRLIRELKDLPQKELRSRLQRLGDEASGHLAHVLPPAVATCRRVVVLTHVPPFRESCWHEGRLSDADGLPFFACKASGDTIRRFAYGNHRCDVTILCGHTHSPGEARIEPNISVLTGGAEYGRPCIQRILDFAND